MRKYGIWFPDLKRKYGIWFPDLKGKYETLDLKILPKNITQF